MSSLGSFTYNYVDWEIYEGFDEAQVLLQRDCPDCDRGLALIPARFCSRCKGSGFLVLKVDLNEAI